MNLGSLVEWIVSALVVAGAALSLVGSIGLARFPDFFTRLHGPSKATTVGIGSILIASALQLGAAGETLSVHEFLITVFIAITTPVSAHLLAKAAEHRGLPGARRPADQPVKR